MLKMNTQKRTAFFLTLSSGLVSGKWRDCTKSFALKLGSGMRNAAAVNAIITGYPDECPSCRAFFPYTRTDRLLDSRVISVYSMQQDRTTHWRCPDCGHEWERG